MVIKTSRDWEKNGLGKCHSGLMRDRERRLSRGLGGRQFGIHFWGMAGQPALKNVKSEK